jgi:hypothetical protein
MKTEVQLSLIIALCLVAVIALMTDCQKHSNTETTKRQFIAGTNVLTNPVPGF